MKRPVVIGLLISALVLVCAGIGTVIYFANDFNINNPFDLQHIPSVLEESKTLEIDTKEPVVLTVNTDAGDVIVTGGDVDTVQVEIVKTAYDASQARADEKVKTIKYTIEQNGNSIVLNYESPKSVNFNNQSSTVDFILIVPNDAIANVETNSGEVQVAGLNGNVDINSGFGDIKVADIEGMVTVDSNSGQIDLSSINAGAGDIAVSTDFGKLSLEQVKSKNITIASNSGALSLNNVRVTGELFAKSDFGDIEFENGSAEKIKLETNSGKVKITKVNIRSQLMIASGFGDIELIQAIANDYDLHTNSGAIIIDGVKGKLKAYTGFGDIEIKNAEMVILDLKTNSGAVNFSGSLGEGAHNVISDFGSIDLALPSDSKLNVNLTTDFGKINSDIPVTVTLNEDSNSSDGKVVGVINGGGAELTVHANSGSITITAIK